MLFTLGESVLQLLFTLGRSALQLLFTLGGSTLQLLITLGESALQLLFTLGGSTFQLLFTLGGSTLQLLFRCSTLANVSLYHPFFQAWSGCHPSPHKFVTVDVNWRSGKQQVVRLPIAIGASALSKVCLVKVLPEGSVLCTQMGQENALGGVPDECLVPCCSMKGPCNSVRHWPAWGQPPSSELGLQCS